MHTAFSFSFSLLTQNTGGLDERINEAFMPVALWWEQLVFTEITLAGVGVPIVLILLIFGAVLFTLRFRFINIRHFGTALQVVRGKFDELERDAAGNQGEVNHFQALTTAVSGTVGLGNIAMVAVAISVGGPGATFWMILTGLLGMSSKFVECTLGVKYRDMDEKGSVYGGPMYYLSKGLKSLGLTRLGKVLAGVFALLCVGASFGGGNAFQSNQATAQLVSRFGLDGSASGTLIGVLFAILVGIVIIGGIQRIAKVTERIVPFMALLYVLGAGFIILSQWENLGTALALILEEAFTPRASVSGGFAGVLIQGLRRAAFSNEAGAGSAAIAHAAVKTRYAASEGLVGLLEPFIDTVLICTMTSLVIVLFNLEGVFVYGDALNNEVLLQSGERIGGVNLTSMAFEAAIPGASYVLAIAVLLFAFSTIISWSYYGLQSWNYLFGRSQVASMVYKVLFLVFTVLGAAVTLDAVIKFSDAMILALVFPNMIGLLLLYPKAGEALKKYLCAIQKLQP